MVIAVTIPPSPASTTTEDSTPDDDLPPPLQADPAVKTRRTYTIKEKRSIVKSVQDLMKANPSLSQNKACKIIGIPSHYVSRFIKTLAKVKEIESSATLAPVHITGDRVSLHPGKKSSLDKIEAVLLKKVLELRDAGFQASSDRVRLKAAKLDRDFNEKNKKAQQMITARFIKKAGLVYRVSTHVAQKHFKETEMASKYFVTMARDRVNALPPEAVWNMDQTPIFYSYV